MKTTWRTPGQPSRTSASRAANRGSAMTTWSSASLTMCRIWLTISCLFSGLKTAPMHGTANIVSRCSAQLNIREATRASPATPSSSRRAWASAAARAAIWAKVVSSPRPFFHVVTRVRPCTEAP